MTRDEAEKLLREMRHDLSAMIDGDVLPRTSDDVIAHRAHQAITGLLDSIQASKEKEAAETTATKLRGGR